MAIRIDIASNGTETLLRLAGSLRAPEADQLKQVSEPITGPLALDLSELLSAEGAGIDVIRSLVRKGAETRGATPYIRMLLADVSLESGSRE